MVEKKANLSSLNPKRVGCFNRKENYGLRVL